MQRTGPAYYFIFLILGSPQLAFAWGGLGHRVVAENAAWLLDDARHDAWSQLIWRHRFELGIYAFEPDSRFRHEDGHDGEAEAPMHVWVQDSGEGKAPQRILQFAGLAQSLLHEGEGVGGGYGRGSDASAKAQAVFRGLYYLGVMAHYTGDAGVPFHGSTNVHAFDTGQGGLHFYFESDCVNALEPGLAPAALAIARDKREQWRRAAPAQVQQLVEQVFIESGKQVGEVVRLDAEHALVAKGKGKDFARRRAPALACKAFENLLAQRLAKAAWLTAEVWSRSLPTGPGPAATLQFSDLARLPFVPPP